MKIRYLHHGYRTYISINDLFEYFIQKDLVRKNGSNKWNLITDIFATHLKALKKGKVDSLVNYNFLKIGFDDFFLDYLEVQAKVKDFMPKRKIETKLYRDLMLKIDNIRFSQCEELKKITLGDLDHSVLEQNN